jgi:very-short-patch-repair endonuclease
MGVVCRPINPHAARLRREMTDAEKAFWFELRNRRLADFKFKSQWSLGPFVADFCCLSRRLVIEVDGGQHDETADAWRTARLNEHGFRVLRFWNNDVLTNMDGVLQVIVAALEKEQDPHPNQHRVNVAPRRSGHAGGMTDPMLPRAGEGV